MNVSSDLHALGVTINATDEQEQKRFLDIFVTVDLRSDGASQFVVEIVLGHLAAEGGERKESLHFAYLDTNQKFDRPT